MDPRQLAVLRELGDRGSVTAVAEALYITPSAVSQQLAALQRNVPVALTQRQGRTLVLTDAGRALAAAAVDVATALVRAETAVDAFLDDPRGPVRVAAFSSAATAFFPALLQAAAAGGAPVRCAEHDVAQARFPRCAPTTTSCWPTGSRTARPGRRPSPSPTCCVNPSTSPSPSVTGWPRGRR